MAEYVGLEPPEQALSPPLLQARVNDVHNRIFSHPDGRAVRCYDRTFWTDGVGRQIEASSCRRFVLADQSFGVIHDKHEVHVAQGGK